MAALVPAALPTIVLPAADNRCGDIREHLGCGRLLCGDPVFLGLLECDFPRLLVSFALFFGQLR